MLEQSETILEASTRSVVVGVRNTTGAASVDERIDRYAEALDIQVTVIGPGGEVIGDSERTPSELTSMENHANRPEVVEALEAGVGLERQEHSGSFPIGLILRIVPPAGLGDGFQQGHAAYLCE